MPISFLRGYESYCQGDGRTDSEVYLSAFQHGSDFAEYVTLHHTEAGYSGPATSLHIHYDIDRAADIELARTDTAILCQFIIERYLIPENELLIFFSGSKGFHVEMPSSLCGEMPLSSDYYGHIKAYASMMAAMAGVKIDESVYSRNSLFRAPNSKHGKTGLFKRQVTFDELTHMAMPEILQMATTIAHIEIPSRLEGNEQAMKDWNDAVGKNPPRPAGGIHAKQHLNRLTIDYIRFGAAEDRHKRLFSAAANLSEFNCTYELAYALLSERALDSGLCPSDVKRQIQCGLNGGTNE